MQTVTIKEAQDMVGQVIPRIEGKITHLYPRQQKTGAKGTWFQQKGSIEDATGKMTIVFNDSPEQTFRLGKSFIFKSSTNNRGMSGVKVNSWEGKQGTNIELVITATALILTSDEEAHVSQATPSTRMTIADISPKPHQEVKDGMAMAKNRLTQLAGLYKLTYKTAEAIADDNELIEDAQIKDIATTLFIQAVREGLADKMPIRTKFFNEKELKPEGNYRGEPEDDPYPTESERDDPF